MRRNDLITLQNVTDLPARQNVRNRAVFLNAAHLYLCHQLPTSVDQQLTILEYALVRANIHNHKLPFGIGGNNFAFKGGWQIDGWGTLLVLRQFTLQRLDLAQEDLVFGLGCSQMVL